MKESFDSFANAIIDDVDKFQKTIEVIDWIADIASKVIEGSSSLAELNDMQLRLSGLLSRLGTVLSDLNNYSNASISYRKLKRVNEFCFFKQHIDKQTEKWMTDTKAGAFADDKCSEDIRRELGFMARYNKINILYSDTSRLVTSIQSHLKQEQAQRFSQNNQT